MPVSGPILCICKLNKRGSRSLCKKLCLNVMAENISAAAGVILASLLYDYRRQKPVIHLYELSMASMDQLSSCLHLHL